MTKMNRILGFTFEEEKKEGSITLQPGVTLGELGRYMKRKRMDTSMLAAEDTEAWGKYQESGKIRAGAGNRRKDVCGRCLCGRKLCVGDRYKRGLRNRRPRRNDYRDEIKTCKVSGISLGTTELS